MDPRSADTTVCSSGLVFGVQAPWALVPLNGIPILGQLVI